MIIMEGKGKVTNIQFTKASDLVGTRPATKTGKPYRIFYRLKSLLKGELTVVLSINGKFIDAKHHTLETDDKVEDAWFDVPEWATHIGQNAFQFRYGDRFPKGYADKSYYQESSSVFTVEVV